MDQPVKIKICGNTNAEDAQFAASLGADFLGLIFSESPRRIDISQAQKIIGKVSSQVSWVGVFRNESIDKVREFASRLNLTWIQLHGNEDVDYVHRLLPEFRVLKAFIMQGTISQGDIEQYPEEWVLLDIPKDSGQTLDIEFAERISRIKKIFLAGGLRPENVAEAIQKVKPFAVDVCRGVEAFPGRKDPHKLQQFIEAVKKRKQT